MVSAIYNNVSCHSYAADILMIDDAASTNIYEMKLEVMIAIAAESRSQLYAFGLLSLQDQSAYKAFFADVEELTGQSPRVIVAHRCPAQFLAAREIFPKTHGIQGETRRTTMMALNSEHITSRHSL